MLALVIAVALAGGGSQPVAPPSADWTKTQTVRPPGTGSGHRLIDLDRDGRMELVHLTASGEVLVYAHAGGESALGGEPRGSITLERPSQALVDFARFGETAALVVASPRGLEAYPLGDDGSFAPDGVRLARRARFPFRTNEPQWTRFMRDVNGDGRPDCVLPQPSSCVLWQNVGPAPAEAGSGGADAPGTNGEDELRWPRFQRTAQIAVPVQRTVDQRHEYLSHVLKHGFTIPGLTTDDVNGDGKDDLLVADGDRRAFHLQNEDGTYPVAPTVQLDLSIFRDTTERAKVVPGRTLAGSDSATYESRDLDGDEIPDYVIAHRRKVWVFHASTEGPQFEDPSTILKAADDVTALMLLHLNDDERVDLMLLKVQVPTIATIVRGIFGEWDVEISAAGYSNLDGRNFETAPSQRGEIIVRMPAILSVLKDPEALIERFEQAGERVGRAVYGDFDGNGERDVALATRDDPKLRVWLSETGGGVDPTREDVEDVLRRLLFEDEDRVWDIDRILLWLGNFAERRAALLTGGRDPDGEISLRDAEEWELRDVRSADFRGSGQDVFVLGYAHRSGAVEFDLIEKR